MRRRRLFWQFLLPALVVVLAAVLLATWDSVRVRRQFHLEQTASVLETQARLIQRLVPATFDPQKAKAATEACRELSSLTGSRITLIRPSGRVLADSYEDPAAMDNHADRAEVAAAFGGEVGQAIRHSYTLHNDRLYVAVPFYENGELAGVIRTSRSLASVSAALRDGLLRSLLGGGIVALFAVAMFVLVTRRVTRPLGEMERKVKRFARGDFEARLAIPGSAELAELAGAMNKMAVELEERIQAMQRQHTELNAVVSSMSEGIIAVDSAQRVVRLNHAAARLFRTTPEAARGKTMLEVARNPVLHRCVTKVLDEGKPVQDELVLAGPREAVLQVSGTPLRTEAGDRLGALLVVKDVTQLRALEKMRSDFVANVSHEIRTPVTSIKGYAETLLNDFVPADETAARFLAIVARQADRLCALVDDILALSSLEKTERTGEPGMDEVDVQSVIDSAVHVCAMSAEAKQAKLTVKCEKGLRVLGDRALLEQALVNLVDNAVKYSNTGGTVAIEAVSADAAAKISVRDEGIGIPPEHLPRIFERFYRVDRARSREAGGTGLGLAIVKHIAALHRGRVSVESEPGKGSSFFLHIPKEPEARKTAKQSNLR